MSFRTLLKYALTHSLGANIRGGGLARDGAGASRKNRRRPAPRTAAGRGVFEPEHGFPRATQTLLYRLLRYAA